jgi:NADPH:quinone reductase
MLAITIPERHTQASPAPPNSLLSKEQPIPTPSASQALIRVHAAATSPFELSWAYTYQYPGICIPVHDVAGVVVSAPDSSKFAVGTEVFGLLRFTGNGALAEYAVADVDILAGLPAPRAEPDSLRFVQAASVPRAALTAWQALVTRGKLRKGEKVLITGATGAVGRMGVQIARWVLSETGKITATGGKGVEQLDALGADTAFSYRAESGWETSVAADGKVDFVFDCVGGETLEKCVLLVRDGGRVFTVASNSIPGWEKSAGGRMLWRERSRWCSSLWTRVESS